MYFVYLDIMRFMQVLILLACTLYIYSYLAYLYVRSIYIVIYIELLPIYASTKIYLSLSSCGVFVYITSQAMVWLHWYSRVSMRRFYSECKARRHNP